MAHSSPCGYELADFTLGRFPSRACVDRELKYKYSWFLPLEPTWKVFWSSKFLLSVSLVSLAGHCSHCPLRSGCWQTAGPVDTVTAEHRVESKHIEGIEHHDSAWMQLLSRFWCGVSLRHKNNLVRVTLIRIGDLQCHGYIDIHMFKVKEQLKKGKPMLSEMWNEQSVLR